MWKIIRCSNCGTPQYIRESQKSRKCPRCGYRIKCENAKIIASASSELEASEFVRSMKTPCEIEQRIAKLKSQISKTHSSKVNQMEKLGQMITELLFVFPNALPEDVLYEKAKELAIPEELVDKTFGELSNEGLMLINKDFKGKKIFKFPSLPISQGSLLIKRPITRKEFNKQKW